MTSWLRREITLVVLGGYLLAVAMTWPTLWHPATTVPGDLGDPLAQSWIAAWGGHALTHAPAHLVDGNVFYPLDHSYAFTDTLLGYAPAGFVTGGYGGTLLRYNLLYVLAFALAFVGAYALARQLGSRPVGALLAGAAFAYAPWRLAQDGHLNIVSSGGIPLALALLARGHGYGRDGFARQRVRPGMAVLGWLVAAWQVSLGFALGLTFCYVLLAIAVVAVIGWLVAGRPGLGRRLVLADLLGAPVFTLVAALLAVPYLRVLHDQPEAGQRQADLAFYSPPLSGFFTSPAADRIWGAADAGLRHHLGWPPEMTLLPGYALLVLAVVGLLGGKAPARRRGWLAAVVVLSVVLALGTRFAGGHLTILPMAAHLPGWQSVRTTGRLVLWTTLALGLLAAYGVTRLQEVLQRNRLPPRAAGAILLVLPLLVLGEGLGAVPHPAAPVEPAALRAVRSAGPVLVLPSDDSHDTAVMAWSTDGFVRVANGSTSFDPRQTDQLRVRAASFPDARSAAYLRSLGFRSVVLLPGYAYGTPWQGAENRPYAGLPLSRRRVGNDYVYTLAAR